MKFIIKTFGFLLTLVVFAAAYWFLLEPEDRGELFENTVTIVTGKSYDETLVQLRSITLDDVKDDDLLTHARRHSEPTFVCPMHPQIVKGEPGNCPICGMNLVEKEVVEEKPMQAKATKPKEKKIKFWVAPMDANYRRDEPGKSPMGMDLVPVYEELDEEEPMMAKAAKSKEKKIKYWVAPMDANFRRDEPGKSPMGMDLVPVFEEAEADMDDGKGLPKITIIASTAQNMGVRIEKATINELSRTIKTIGSITYNEDSQHHIHVRTNGWVEEVYTQSLGDPVTKGKSLLEFYSPDIVAAQKDLIVSKRAGSTLMESSKTRLRDLNVPESVIEKVSSTGKSQNRIPIIVNHTGVVTRIGIKNGMYITPNTELYTIADLSSVWVIVDVFEHQLTWVKVGNRAEVKVQGVPERDWEGKVEYIYPELNPKTRTLKVRLKIDTPDQLLKPNMFADVTLFTNDKQALTVPTEAIIYYENSPRVVKVVAENKYQPVEVKIGMKSNGRVEIVEGIEAGDDILVSGQFMIDSESNLQASFRRLTGK